MVTKTAREILKEAKTLANADNSAFTNFFLSTTLLNNAYRDVYSVLVNNSLAFAKSINIVEDTELPDDFFQLISVQTKASGRVLEQRQITGSEADGFCIENGVIKSSVYPVKVTYAPTPATITAPDEWKKLDHVYDDDDEFIDGDYNVPSFISITEDDDDNLHYQVLGQTDSYFDKDFDITIQNKIVTKISWGGEDVTEYFKRDDVDIVTFNWDEPYIAVSYSDEKTFIFTGFDSATEYNYECITGHSTKGKVIAMSTDDTTGFGLIFQKYNKVTDSYDYYYAPFVPDTVLAYPNNTLFTYLEFAIAFIIAGLLNMDTAFIEKQRDQARQDLVSNVGGTTNAYRMNNLNFTRVWGARR